jgi:hypothetical protein
MKKMMFALAIAGAAVAAATPADARDGCGRGFHRAYNGHCRPNRGPVMVAPGALIVGNYYNGRGYWDGRRYYQNRYRYRNNWRYR